MDYRIMLKRAIQGVEDSIEYHKRHLNELKRNNASYQKMNKTLHILRVLRKEKKEYEKELERINRDAGCCREN